MRACFTSFFLGCFFFSSAQWSDTTNQFYDSLHMQACTAVGTQENPVVLQSFPDGGYFIIWEDRRNGFYSNTKIYAQKYDSNGNPLWAANGVPISAGTNRQHYTYAGNVDYRNYSIAATDSAGGFYITYADDSITNYVYERVMVQHIRNDGNAVFPNAGYIRASSTTNNLNLRPQLIADGNKGFFLGFVHPANQQTYVYVDCYKDENGVMKYYGGSVMNQNVILKTNPPCNNHTVEYPGTSVIDYEIYSDLQKGCNVVFSMSQNFGSGGNVFTGFNGLWRVKKDSRVSQNNGTLAFYPKDSVLSFYNVVIRSEYPFQCGNTIYTEYFLESNGFLQVSNLTYDMQKAKGTVIETDGNINANIIAVNERKYINNSVTDWFTKVIYHTQQKFDSIPYQYTVAPYKPYTYSGGPPPGQHTLSGPNNSSNDTLLYKPGASYFYDFSLASGGNKIFATGIMGNGPREVLLQQMQVQRTSSTSFEVQLRTSSKKGIVIGKELATGYTGTNINYDNPQVVADNNGNGLFYIREYYKSARVSPIFNGAELAWGAMGRAIGTGVYNNGYYNFEQPAVALDPQNGNGVISWRDNRNIPGSTSENIFMRHLDELNVSNYSPPNRVLKLFNNGSSLANPAALLGTSNKYSAIEVYNGTTGTTSPVIEILDNYNLGNVEVSVFQNTSPIRTYNGKPYLNRNYTIKAENNPGGAANINLRLFFTTTEFDALKAADPSITNPGSLVVVKQPNNTITVPSAYTPVAGEQVIVPTTWAAVAGGYYVEIVVTGFSNFFIMKNTGVLPVTWLGVQAQWLNNAQAKVSWQVAEQINVKDYVVQFSADGTSYTDVCEVAASAQTQYSCIVPASSTAKNYYRVVEQDRDGRKSYSKVVVLQSGIKSPLVIYPNPAKDKLYINGINDYSRLQISDANGRIIHRQNILPGMQYVNVNHFAPGVYVLMLTGNNDVQTLRFVKD